MKTLHIFCLLIFFLLTVKGFDGFSQQAVFTPVPPPGGTWGPAIFSGSQDPNGYMWFGSSGLHRYDGYSYKSYFNDPSNASSLASNIILTVCAGRNGIIWVGTGDAGLDRLDPETGIFTHFRHNPHNTGSLSSNSVPAVLEDRDGKIWVGTGDAGLNCLDPKTGIITHFRHNPNNTNSLSDDQVFALYEDHQGTIWIGTGLPYTRDKSKEGGLNRFNRANKNFVRFLHDPNDPSTLIDNRIRAIFEDSKGRFWVGTSGDGLHTMNREKGTFDRHQYNAADPNGLSRPPLRNTISWADDLITFINEDATGTIWIGTISGGLNRYDPETRKMSYYPSLDENSKDKDPVVFWWSYTSKDGVLWIFANYDVYRMDPLHKQIPHYDIGSPVGSLLQDRTGKLWLGTDQGLVCYDTARINKKWFKHDVSDTMSLSSGWVFSIFEDRQGTIWILTDKGLNRYNQQSQRFTSYLINNGRAIYEDRQGSFWLGTFYEGLALMNKQAGTFTYYTQYTPDTTTLSGNNIFCIGEDRAGYLWIGTYLNGLNRYDKRNKRFQHYLPGTTIKSIFEDADGVLWIGTYQGLYYLNRSNNGFVLFTNQASGLLGNITISHILEDDHQSLWVNTSIGLFRLRHNRSEISLFGKMHGIFPPARGTQHNCFKGKRGELFFGDINNGYYAFFPEQLTRNETAPDLQITGFRFGDQLVVPDKGGPLYLPISRAQEIQLNYKQNVFSFEFAGIHYSSPEDNRHLFMLENFDNDWRKAGEERTAYYSDVPPGNYVFRIKAASSEGVWAEKSIVIIISPPWWKTWWAYCIYALLLIGGVVVIDRVRKKKVINAERERTREKELAQAKEIEKAYSKLKSTQAQLIQSEKMASLGELTAGIAHEIQNPLNFVNNFSEVNTELLAEMKNEMIAGNHEEAGSLADNIIENGQKIIHHGKRADAIVKGMLQHSRVSSGKKEPTNINALADEYLRLAYHGFRAKDNSFNATLKTDFDENIGNINIIPQDIGRVILNLINNAFYAVDEKRKLNLNGYEPLVSISTKNTYGKIEIKVKDNGNGIPQKVLDKIFQPFFTTKPTGQGTGLGLSLSYDIIKAHGGEMKVETNEGESSTFIIQLPITS